MDKPILIGIHGVKRAGKGTVARFVKEWAQSLSPAMIARDRGFADKAKWAFARQFSPDISMADAIKWVDEFKDTNAVIFFRRWDEKIEAFFDTPVPFRRCMAQFATEGARDIYGDNHWVRQLLPPGSDPLWGWQKWHHEFSYKADENSYAVADICTISDLRFENEVYRIKQVGGICLKIRRKDADDAVIEEARKQGREVHRSELGLPDELFDYVINNDDNDMDRARERTEAFCQHFVLKQGVLR